MLYRGGLSITQGKAFAPDEGELAMRTEDLLGITER